MSDRLLCPTCSCSVPIVTRPVPSLHTPRHSHSPHPDVPSLSEGPPGTSTLDCSLSPQSSTPPALPLTGSVPRGADVRGVSPFGSASRVPEVREFLNPLESL